jgi:hypothetical protein
MTFTVLNDKKVINIEVDGVYGWDAPDFCDAYISYADFEDGTPLTDEEIEKISDSDFVHDLAWESFH